MVPISFTVKGGITHFHYKASELIDFIRRGKKDGNVGVILTKREGEYFTYRGFGTIENPWTYIATISVEHCSIFDGEMPTNEQILIPPKPLFLRTSNRIIIHDSSKKD